MQPSSHHRSARVRIVASAGLSLLAIILLGACGTEDAATGRGAATTSAFATTTESVAPITTTLPPITVTDTVDSATGASRSTADTASTDCAPDIGRAAAAQRDIPRLRHQFDGAPWRVTATGGTWCGGLSWVTVRASTVVNHPEQLMLYRDGHFLGTGLDCSARRGQDVLSTTRDAVTVSYHVVDDSIPEQRTKQDALGRRVVTFRWNGSRVVMEGTPPPADAHGNC